MIRIALCDDSIQVMDYYQKLITESAAEASLNVKITRYESGEQMLFMLSDSPNEVDIIYLDILMGKMDGVETARRLRALGCVAQIIFLTTSDEYVFEAFEAEPYYYIIKDEMPVRKFKDIFYRAVESVHVRANDFISVTAGGATVKLKLDEILFFEVQNRIVTVHTNRTSVSYYAKLEDVEKSLADKGFIRIHRSYLVNSYYIQKLTRTSLKLSNGQELPISEKNAQYVQQEFSKYLLKI